ncbi:MULTISPECIES: Lrp/AsnC family transcriptional regulator [unclassified Nocardia]|uniref:Lrp/AsnC family transcriptional regulator n=1 Tax=unclassified Nocardia TaxID=2637762 RepID=UPI0033BD50D7
MTHPGPESGIGETDLALIDAIQCAPRAPWSRIGPVVGLDPTTAARRWTALCDAGLVWVTAYESGAAATVAFVELRCHPSAIERIGSAVSAEPWVFTVDETAGEYDLLISVASADLPALARWLRVLVAGLDGVHSTRIRVGTRCYRKGAGWRVGVLSAAQSAALTPLQPAVSMTYSTHTANRPSPQDQTLVDALGPDARMSYIALGTATGTSEYAARRRLQRLIRSGVVMLRGDFAYAPAGLSTLAIYRLVIPHAELDHASRRLAERADVCLCTSITGGANLMVKVVCAGLDGLHDFETALAAQSPAARIEDRTIVVRTRKRLGRLLDDTGRAIGHVPFGPPVRA